MIPKFMTVEHDPPNSYGDCFRCCVASILEVEPTDVPHPYEGGEDEWETRYHKLTTWLREKHQVWIAFFHVQAEYLDNFLATYDGYVLLGGRSPRDAHLVVADRTGIVHNPNPLNDGLSPNTDGTYHIGFICRGVR